jgi:hypothetical protein
MTRLDDHDAARRHHLACAAQEVEIVFATATATILRMYSRLSVEALHERSGGRAVAIDWRQTEQMGWTLAFMCSGRRVCASWTPSVPGRLTVSPCGLLRAVLPTAGGHVELDSEHIDATAASATDLMLSTWNRMHAAGAR